MVKLEIFRRLAGPDPGDISTIDDTVSHCTIPACNAPRAVPENRTGMTVKENAVIDNKPVTRGQHGAIDADYISVTHEHTLIRIAASLLICS